MYEGSIQRSAFTSRHLSECVDERSATCFTFVLCNVASITAVIRHAIVVPAACSRPSSPCTAVRSAASLANQRVEVTSEAPALGLYAAEATGDFNRVNTASSLYQDLHRLFCSPRPLHCHKAAFHSRNPSRAVRLDR